MTSASVNAVAAACNAFTYDEARSLLEWAGMVVILVIIVAAWAVKESRK